MAIVTRESITEMLNNPNPRYVQTVIGRALVALLKRQTASERNSNSTNEHNAVGFSSVDARSGSLTAKYWMKHNKLEDWMVNQWTRPYRGHPRLSKYHRQLDEIAESKK